MSKEIYGSTGARGVDGLLTPEQFEALNRLQESAANSAHAFLQNRQPEDLFPMVGMATGIGKGNIIHRTIEKQIRQKPDSKVLLIAGTKVVLVKQTHEALAGYQDVPNGEPDYIESEDDEEIVDETTSTDSNLLEGQRSLLYRTGKLGQTGANVQVATIQTVQSEINKGNLDPSEYDLVIVDEVHNIGTSKRKEVIQQFDRVFGLTATPFRHSGKMKKPADYGFEVIESLTLPEAQEMRLLPPLLGIQIDTKEVIDEIPTTRTGLIDFKKLEKLLKNSPELRPFIADRIAQIISDDEGNKYKTVIAVNFVWEAEEIASWLHAKGIKVGVAVNQQAAKQIHTDEIPAIDTIERYKLPEDDERSIQVLISPYVASEGFDAPFTEVLVWASPTDSQLRYTQYTGRLARRADGKLFGVVVDCLYQTEQYRWSYNMGMWMKGDVRQLDNGMLWLGPETDIEGLKDIHSVQMMSKHSDRKPLGELQETDLQEILETDFPMTKESLLDNFEIGTQRVLKIGQKIIDEVMLESPHLVERRINSSAVVTVITDREEVFRRMREIGVPLRDKSILAVQEGDIPITMDTLQRLFTGVDNRLRALQLEAVAEIERDHSELVAKRKSGKRTITVVRDLELFTSKMLEKGARLKSDDIEEVKETDAPITYTHIDEMFIGGYKKNAPIVQAVLAEIKAARPELIVGRRSGWNPIATVVSDRELFIRMMEEKGAISKDQSTENIKETDFTLTQKVLSATFRGGYPKILAIAQSVLEEISAENPDLVKKRRNVNRTVTAITDRDLFVSRMLEKGARLREES